MTIVADECVNGLIVKHLRDEGFAVDWIHEIDLGAVDPSVLDRAERSDHLVLTEDKDFGELVFRDGLAHAGVVLLRLKDVEVNLRIQIVLTLFKTRFSELKDAFTTVTAGKIRIRKTIFETDETDDKDYE